MATESNRLKPAESFLFVRRKVERRIVLFSLFMGVVGMFLAGVGYSVSILESLRDSQGINRAAVSQISCDNSSCDASAYTMQWWIPGPDYLIDVQTRYLVDVAASEEGEPVHFSQLEFLETSFIRKFRQPGQFATPTGEIWRLYSQPAEDKGQNREIILGYAEKAPWKMLSTSVSDLPRVDDELKREGIELADHISDLRQVPTLKLSADGYLVVVADTGKVVVWGPPVPSFLPPDRPLPSAGSYPYLNQGKLYIVTAYRGGRFMAVSLVQVGSIRWLAALAMVVFLLTSAITRILSRRFLRNYFAVTSVKLPTLEGALRSGEGQRVEFKRGLSEDETKKGVAEDELLKSVAAFANTNDGVIFVGVDDSGKIKGLAFDTKQKDRFERKVLQLTRSRVKPFPPIEISFANIRECQIAQIIVARGEEPIYMLNGVIYLRSGSSDVQAQPEEVQRLFLDYAY